MTKADSLPEGTQGQASSEGSNKEVINKGSSQPEYVTVEQFNKLMTQIESLRRTGQSDKDKGIKAVAERVDALDNDLKAVLKSAQGRGQNISDVLAELDEQEELETRRMMREFLASQKSGASGNESGGSGSKLVDVTGIIAEYELDPEDTRVQAFRSKQYSSEADAYREAGKLLKSMTKQPSEADLPSKVASERQPAPKQEALEQEYKDRSKGIRGQELIALQREMRRKGLRI